MNPSDIAHAVSRSGGGGALTVIGRGVFAQPSTRLDRESSSKNLRQLVAFHVYALPLIPVPTGPVSAAVDHTLDGLDTQIAVAHRFVVSFVVRLCTSKPSAPAPFATLRLRRLWSSFFPTIDLS